jgi:hypothetical protein
VRIGVLLLLVGCVLPVPAHHSFAAEFDDKQPLNLDGTVVKVDFMNHIPEPTWKWKTRTAPLRDGR